MEPAKIISARLLFNADSMTRENTPTLKVRKKPIIVDAVQIHTAFQVTTLEGHSKEGQPGDYLMFGVEGEKYPIAQHIFDKTYDIVSYPVTEGK